MNKNEGGNILVCVKNKNTASRLISIAKKLSYIKRLPLQVLYIKPSNEGYSVNSDEMEYMYSISKKAQAEYTVFFNDNPSEIAANFAKEINAKYLVLGTNSEGNNTFVESVKTLLPNMPICTMSSNGCIHNISPILEYLNIKPKSLKIPQNL